MTAEYYWIPSEFLDTVLSCCNPNYLKHLSIDYIDAEEAEEELGYSARLLTSLPTYNFKNLTTFELNCIVLEWNDAFSLASRLQVIMPF